MPEIKVVALPQGKRFDIATDSLGWITLRTPTYPGGKWRARGPIGRRYAESAELALMKIGLSESDAKKVVGELEVP